MTTPQVYSFIRFSTKQQAKGDSDRRQETLRDAWLKAQGLKLDDTKKLHHIGSAFRGKHKTKTNNPDENALYWFLKMVEEDEIPKGSFLIVESLDRLTREHISDAAYNLLGLINSGIKIVQLSPHVMIYERTPDITPLIIMVVELSRGHSESKLKSERLLERWNANRDNAIKGKKTLGKRCPAWLSFNGSDYIVDEDKKKIIENIFTWAIEGLGLTQITRKLNKDNIKPIAGKRWSRVYIDKMLRKRHVLGEYQPRRLVGQTYRDLGATIPNYYPAIISEEVWNMAHAEMCGRRKLKTRVGKRDDINIFAGMLYSAYGGKLQRKENRLVPVGNETGSLERTASFNYDVFETSVLSKLTEIKPQDIIIENKGIDNLDFLTTRKIEVDKKIKKVQYNMVGEGDIDSLFPVLKKLEQEQKELIEKIREENNKISNPVVKSWSECKTLIDVLNNSEDKNEVKQKIRSHLFRIVDSIYCLFIKQKVNYIAVVQMFFKDSKEHRGLLIWYRRKTRFNNADSGMISNKGITDFDLRKFAELPEVQQQLIEEEMLWLFE